MEATVGSVGEGAPLPARDRPSRRFQPAINGTEQRLDALLELGDAILHELCTARLDRAGLDEVREGDPVLELLEPASDATYDPGPIVPPAPAAPVELTEPAPGPVDEPPARPAKKAAAKRTAKKAAPKR